tara:strand:- start:539 stop:1012 length:474 start_codon:yes stop_codon:yes gene_type:complete
MRNKIEIIDEFLSDELCNYFINYFEKNESLRTTHKVNNGYLVDIDITKCKEFSDLFNKINNHVKDQRCKIDWIKVTKWEPNLLQGLHQDDTSPETVYASIMYLNDNYKGGKTYFKEGTIVQPKKGRALFFNGMRYWHGVMPVKEEARYTIAAWYKER